MISAQVDAQPTNTPRQVLDVHGDPITPQARPAGCGVIGLIVAVVVLVGLGVAAYFVVPRLLHPTAATAGGRGARGGGGSVPVVAAPVVKGDMDLYLTGLGTVTAYNTVTVRPRVDGQIMAIHFNEGQFVKEGQLLIEIDPRPYQVQLAQAQGQLMRDQALLDNARRDLDRYQSIKGSVTQQQIDTQVASVAQYNGIVESDKSQVDNANLNLVYCKVTAPISGRIGLRLVDVGNLVHASDANGLLVITQLQPIAMIFTVAEDQISEVLSRPDHGQGLPVEAYNRDLTAVLARGKLLAIDNQVDPSTGTVKIKAEFANEDDSLFPNEFVNAKLLVKTLKGVTIVPAAAVQLGPQDTFVYVVKPDKKVELRTVKTGPREGGQEVIEEGLKPGELVVTDGVDKLTQGTTVIPHAPNERGRASTRPAGASTGNAPAGRSGRSGGKGGAATQPASAPIGGTQPRAAVPHDPLPNPPPEYSGRENVNVALVLAGSDAGNAQ
jgi:membrane fusion protein, multidrug efflux system